MSFVVSGRLGMQPAPLPSAQFWALSLLPVLCGERRAVAESPPACPLPGPGQEPGRTSQTLSSALRALGAFKTSASLSLRLSFQWSPPFPTLHPQGGSQEPT